MCFVGKDVVSATVEIIYHEGFRTAVWYTRERDAGVLCYASKCSSCPAYVMTLLWCSGRLCQTGTRVCFNTPTHPRETAAAACFIHQTDYYRYYNILLLLLSSPRLLILLLLIISRCTTLRTHDVLVVRGKMMRFVSWLNLTIIISPVKHTLGTSTTLFSLSRRRRV